MAAYSANQVWATAVAADRINGGLVRGDQDSGDVLELRIILPMSVEADPILRPGTDTRKPAFRTPNRIMVADSLDGRKPIEVTSADEEYAKLVKQHFKHYVMRPLEGKELSQFGRLALRLASEESYPKFLPFEFSVIALMPAMYKRDLRSLEIKQQIEKSNPVHFRKEDAIAGHVRVVEMSYIEKHTCYACQAWFEGYAMMDIQGHQARTNGPAFVTFFTAKAPKVNKLLDIRAKIKEHRGDVEGKVWHLSNVKIESVHPEKYFDGQR